METLPDDQFSEESGVEDREKVLGFDNIPDPSGQPVDQFTPMAQPIEFDPEEMTDEEKVLSVPVQGLLDEMNELCFSLNEAENEIRRLESDRVGISVEWKIKKIELLNTIGAKNLNRSRPVFEAYQEQLTLQGLVNEAVQLYTESVSEVTRIRDWLDSQSADSTTLEDTSLLLLDAQTRRDTYQRLSNERTVEFQAASGRYIESKRLVGAKTLDKASPWFEEFSRRLVESKRVESLVEDKRRDMGKIRNRYKVIMEDLEKISQAIHESRQYRQNMQN
jgi:hypothetical protein